MNRRHFMQSILALGAAPAIVRADSLMRIVPRDRLVSWEPVVMDAEAARQIAEIGPFEYVWDRPISGRFDHGTIRLFGIKGFERADGVAFRVINLRNGVMTVERE